MIRGGLFLIVAVFLATLIVSVAVRAHGEEAFGGCDVSLQEATREVQALNPPPGEWMDGPEGVEAQNLRLRLQACYFEGSR